MSNAIRYDALLLHALAGELDERLGGARVARAWFDRPARLAALELGQRDRPWTLSWSLHPAAGAIALGEGRPRTHGSLLPSAPGTRVASVSALPDERIVRIQLEPPGSPHLLHTLVIELVGNRWNAFALGADDVITATLLPRPEPGRALRPGACYAPPAARARLGRDERASRAEWHRLLAPTPPRERREALLAGMAWTSSLNAGFVLGDAALPEAGDHLLDEAYDRYSALLDGPVRPVLLPGGQPYPQPLGPAASPFPSLLEAFEAAPGAASATPALGEAAVLEAARARIAERRQRLEARIERLAQEAAAAAGEAALLRDEADLLLANLHRVPRGTTVIGLEDFSGRPVRIALDPARSAQQNAQQRYEQAKRRQRAAARVPALLARARAQLADLEQTGAQLATGQLAGAELAGWLLEAERSAAAAALPYRRYRTSGGLEVRVGRNARANDALTREHASPEDIWLHARDAGGAHVVLRWGRRAANPPQADLLEAAGLAAWHSRSRTAGVVPVDWTRRKYVRKPRRAPPGLVVPERVRTVFVTPERALEERLRAEEE